MCRKTYTAQRGEDKMIQKQILPLFQGILRHTLKEEISDWQHLQEIRIRQDQPVLLLYEGREIVLNIRGSAGEIRQIVEGACGYSGYAFEEEIRRGYLTVEGGHRIGLAGRAVMTKTGVQTLKYISALNIRVAHPVVGCAARWKEYLYREMQPCHILIVSPPGCGKTTLLRDVIRLFSEGSEGIPGVNVGVVDERSEIGGSFQGKQTHDLGMRTDLLDGCSKAEGMYMLLRSMAPRVIAADEIGSTEDVRAIEEVIQSGCRILATVHSDSMEELRQKPGMQGLLKAKVFERYIFLKKGQTPGVVSAVCGQELQPLWEEGRCI